MEPLDSILRARRARASAALAAERRRIARDLHDGLGQELAFIAMQCRRLAERSPEGTLAQVTEAAERALAECRRAVAALTEPAEEPLHEVISATAERLATRAGAWASFDLDPSVQVPAATRENLLRILGE